MDIQGYIFYIFVTAWTIFGMVLAISYSYGNDQQFKPRLKNALIDASRCGMYAAIASNLVAGPIIIYLKYF